MAVLTPKSVIQLNAFIAFETGRKLNSVCYILLLVPRHTYICTYLSLFIFFVYILFKKNKDKKRLNILKKKNSLKKGEGVPLLNFEVGPGILLLNFEGGPGVPLLNFRGVPGPTFK